MEFPERRLLGHLCCGESSSFRHSFFNDKHGNLDLIELTNSDWERQEPEASSH
jgi:hypothetical protein